LWQWLIGVHGLGGVAPTGIMIEPDPTWRGRKGYKPARLIASCKLAEVRALDALSTATWAIMVSNGVGVPSGASAEGVSEPVVERKRSK
jgi:hypothetical protein